MATKEEIFRLFVEHRSSLFAFLLATTRDYDLSEEILQDVCVVACNKSKQFQSGSNFRAWAREIARRTMLGRFRDRSKSPVLLTEEVLELLAKGFDETDEEAMKADKLAALRRCLEELTPKVRALFGLRYGEQQKLDQMSSSLQKNPEAIRKALYRGRQQLRTCIEMRIQS